jgi:hypothetical protein
VKKTACIIGIMILGILVSACQPSLDIPIGNGQDTSDSEELGCVPEGEYTDINAFTITPVEERLDCCPGLVAKPNIGIADAPELCVKPSEKMPAEFTKVIENHRGDLFLTYDNGKVLLSGTWQRSTPCVNWTAAIGGVESMFINIDIFNSNKDAICIQVIGEPQEINVEIPDVNENTEYKVTYEQKETLFEGTLE